MTMGMGTTVYCPTGPNGILCSEEKGHHPSCERYRSDDARAVKHYGAIDPISVQLRNEALSIFCSLVTANGADDREKIAAFAVRSFELAESFDSAAREAVIAAADARLRRQRSMSNGGQGR